MNREDENYNDKIPEINTRLASNSKGQELIFINNNDIDVTCLNPICPGEGNIVLPSPPPLLVFGPLYFNR